MARDDAFIAHVVDLLAGWGPVSARRMFSGCGLYRDGTIFALILRNVLYLKVDDVNRPDFVRAGMAPFSFKRAGKDTIITSYWEVPPSALDDPDELAELADGALAAARRKQAAKPINHRARSGVQSHRPPEREVSSHRSGEKKAGKRAQRGRLPR